jgi:hypothetical protein
MALKFCTASEQAILVVGPGEPVFVIVWNIISSPYVSISP